MKVTGKVLVIGETKQVSEKYKNRDLVLITDDKYPQSIPFQLSQDKVNLADNLKIGDLVEVSINIRGREWVSPAGEKRYFATLEIWSIQLANISQQPNPNDPFGDDDDDLPFK
jgi:hypothetical protein